MSTNAFSKTVNIFGKYINEFLKSVQQEENRACLIPYVFNSLSGTSLLGCSPRWLKHTYFFDAIDYQVCTKLTSYIEMSFITRERKFRLCTQLVEVCSESVSKTLYVLGPWLLQCL